MANSDSDELRLFIAIKPSFFPKTLDIIDLVKNNFNKSSIKWTLLNNLHITLFFLGNTNKNNLENIFNALIKTSSNIQSFRIKLMGTGSFGRPSPRILWMGIKTEDKLNLLHSELIKNLRTEGIKIAKDNFSPHITIGRIKKLVEYDSLKKINDKFRDNVFQTNEITELLLYKSTLTTNGPVYDILKTFPLKDN